jgi:hypothetical protein
MARKKRTNPAEEQANTASALTSDENSSSVILLSAVSTQEKIALLAYTYWEQRGRTGGSPEEDWFRAESEILSQMNVEVQ